MGRLVQLYEKTGNREKVIEILQMLLEQAPEDPLSYTKIGESAYKNKQYDEAAGYFQKAIELPTADARTYAAIGHFYLRHSEYQLGEKYIREAYKRDPIQYSVQLGSFLYFTIQEQEYYDIREQALTTDTTEFSTAKKSNISGRPGVEVSVFRKR